MLKNVSAEDCDAWPTDHVVQDGNIHFLQGYCPLKQTGHVHSVWVFWASQGGRISCYFLCVFPIKVKHVGCISVFQSGDFILWILRYMLQAVGYDRKECGFICNGVGGLHWAGPTECRLLCAVFWEELLVSYPQSCPPLMWCFDVNRAS